MSSILSSTSCGFFKLGIYEISMQFSNGRCVKDRNKDYTDMYQTHQNQYPNFSLEYDQFKKVQKKMVDQMKELNKTHSANKVEVCNLFASSEWLKLTAEEKQDHKKYHCNGCLEKERLKIGLSMFLVSKFFKKDAENVGITFIDLNKNTSYGNTSNGNTSNGNSSNGNTSTPEEEVMQNVSNLVPQNVLKRYNHIVIKKTVQTIRKKQNTNLSTKEYGSGISSNKTNTVRMISCFESKDEAMKRTVEAKKKIAAGKKKAPNPIGNIHNYEWDKENCLAEVQLLPDGA